MTAAFKIQKRQQFFTFIAKQLMQNGAEGIISAVSELTQQHAQLPEAERVCVGWICPDHDIALFTAINDHGIEFLNEIKNHERYSMQTLKVNKVKLMNRAEWAAFTIKKFLESFNKKLKFPEHPLNSD